MMPILLGGCVDPSLILTFLAMGAAAIVFGALATPRWLAASVSRVFSVISIVCGVAFALIALNDGAGVAVLLFLLPALLGCFALWRTGLPVPSPESSTTSERRGAGTDG